MSNSIQFGANGEVISTESADPFKVGASTSNPFNIRANDTGLGISPELTAAASRSVVDGDGGTLAARAADVSVNLGGSQSVMIGGPTGGGPVQSHDAVRVNSFDFSNGESRLLATARRDGTPRPATALRDTDKIEIHGIETTVAVARHLGFIKADSRTGILDNVSDTQLKEATGEAETERLAAQAAKDQADSLAAQEAAKLSSPEAEEAATLLATRVDENTQVRALIELADAGEVSEQAINRAASQAGIDPSDMRASLAKAMDGYSEQAAAFLAARGIDAAAFLQYMKVEHPSELKAAMIAHVQHRNVGAYAAAVDRYLTNLDKLSPETILNATFDPGVSAHYDPGTRTVILSIPGHGTMSWAGALRAGLIGPYRQRG